MRFAGKKVGFAVTGSLCTLGETLKYMEDFMREGAEVYPLASPAVKNINSRFGRGEEWLKKIKEITGKEPITLIEEAEPIGPGKLLDVLIVAPCTGNTLAKLANGITDTAVLMAVKAHLRNQRPVVLAISTNDGLGINARNIGYLLAVKNIYFVPFGQDNPKEKVNSLVARMDLLLDTTYLALQGKQIQPLLISYGNN